LRYGPEGEGVAEIYAKIFSAPVNVEIYNGKSI
jgi:hypothetical protein